MLIAKTILKLATTPERIPKRVLPVRKLEEPFVRIYMQEYFSPTGERICLNYFEHQRWEQAGDKLVE